MKKIIIKTIILFFIIIQSSFSKENWSILIFDKFISLQFDGEITHGDKLSFNFSKENCDNINYYFSAYSAQSEKDFLALQGQNIPLEINQIKTWGKAVYTSPFLMGHRAYLYLGSYNVSELLNFFSNIIYYKIKIIDHGGFVAKDFFDIKYNQWNLKEFKKAFKTANEKCIENFS